MKNLNLWGALSLTMALLLAAACGQFDSKSDGAGAPVAADIEESGFVRPTIYYFAVINEDQTTCSQKVSMTVDKKPSLKVCPETLKTCQMQGSCAITIQGTSHSYNVSGKQGSGRFAELAAGGDCKFGYGVKSSCLDPFYSVAADMTLYKVGDVIFVPAVVGVVLPSGQVHNGFFVIRDEGGGIKGKGRFDFFSGDLHWKNSRNPFSKIGLQSVSTHVPYYKIRGAKAQSIRAARNYPSLP